jgi:crotonobetainyl-CoA:carnitine CoA-transferase CaiB-like acyl-CoA transferase
MTGHAEPLAAGWHEAGRRSRLRYVFARDFATADGHRVMVAALTPRQFADLATTARLARTFAFLERLLPADFSTRGDLYTHRVTLAALLAPWFARRTVADLAAAFAGTSVPWTHAGRVNTARPMSPAAPADQAGIPSRGTPRGWG